jgi:hypothetical protein
MPKPALRQCGEMCFFDAGRPRGVLAGEPDHLVVNWHIGSRAIDHTRKQESLRPHPSPVAAQLFQKRRAERYIAVAPSLPGAP